MPLSNALFIALFMVIAECSPFHAGFQLFLKDLDHVPEVTRTPNQNQRFNH